MVRKTLKRETALGLIAALVALSAYAMMSEDPALVAARASIIGTLAIPILGFAGAAFGMDWVAKQTEWGGPAAAFNPPAAETAEFAPEAGEIER